LEIVKQGQNPNLPNSLGGINKQHRLKAKKVFNAMYNATPEMKRKYFDASQCPKAGPERSEWLQNIESFAGEVKIQLIQEQLVEQQKLMGKPSEGLQFEKLFKSQRVNVTAVSGLIERVEALQKKSLLL
jgi:hypothetical protein